MGLETVNTLLHTDDRRLVTDEDGEEWRGCTEMDIPISCIARYIIFYRKQELCDTGGN